MNSLSSHAIRYTMINIRSLNLLVLLFIHLIGFGQNHEAYSCTSSVISCYKKYGSKEFKNDNDYLRFVKHIHKRMQSEDLSFIAYNELLLTLATDISYFNKMEVYPYAYELSLNVPQLEKSKFKEIGKVYQLIGNTAYYFRHYGAAKRQFFKALNEKHTEASTRIDCLNTLGLIARTFQDIDSACYYFTKALAVANRERKNEWIGVLSGNLGSCYLKKGAFDKAEQLLRTDFSLSGKQGDVVSAYMAYLSLAEIDLHRGNLVASRQRLEHVLDTLQQNPDLQNSNFYSNLHRFQALYYAQTKQHDKAYEFLLKGQQIKEEEALKREQQDLEKMEYQIRIEQQLKAQELEANKRLLTTIIYVAFILVLLTLLAYLLLALKKRKAERNWLVQESERKAESLKEAEKYISSIKSGIQEKNRIIDQLQEQMEMLTITPLSLEIQTRTLQQIEELKDSVVLTEDDWIHFKRRFEQIHPNFITKLLKLNPSLTNAEIRLATLMKLNLNKTEISNSLGISSDSVRKTNQRLRNKLNLGKQEELIELIHSLS